MQITFEQQTIDLKDRWLAALLAWLVPGLGHYYQGRTAKAVLFCVLILGTFISGLYFGGDSQVGWGRVVYFAWRPDDRRWHYFFQAGIGLPALPALIQAGRVSGGREPLLNNFEAPPRPFEDPNNPLGTATESTLHKHLHRYFELGTVYTMIAGLLNILVIYDAWGGPVAILPRKEERPETPPGETPATK